MHRINIAFTEPESVTWEAVAHLIREIFKISKTTTFSELMKTLESLTIPGATWPGLARPPGLYVTVEYEDIAPPMGAYYPPGVFSGLRSQPDGYTIKFSHVFGQRRVFPCPG